MYDMGKYISDSIKFDKMRLKNYRKIAAGINLPGRLIRRPSRNRKSFQYYYKAPGKHEIYLGRKRYRIVVNLQRKRFVEEMINVLVNNIEAKERFCESYVDESAHSIYAKLPKTYRPVSQFDEQVQNGRAPFPQSENPFRREDLKIKTSFGLYVRSKSELQIAELLYSLGIEFYYEKKLVLNATKKVRRIANGETIEKEHMEVKEYYPDFTIVLPNGDKVYWEHKGMLTKAAYSERDFEKEMIYNENNIYQPHNYIVTAEGPHNAFDMEGINRIVNGWLMPMFAR